MKKQTYMSTPCSSGKSIYVSQSLVMRLSLAVTILERVCARTRVNGKAVSTKMNTFVDYVSKLGVV